MRLGVSLLLALLAGPAMAAAPPPAPVASEVKVAAGSYYVGKATGIFDYKKMANATTPGFLVMRAEVTQGLLEEVFAWGTLHGYDFEDACKTCDRDHDDRPAGGVSWRDAALLANAMSERAGLDAVYRDRQGQPVHAAADIEHAVVEPSLPGYRIPTIPEWQIALRGADKAMADGSYGGPVTSPNALGLIDTAGPLVEWTASSMDLGDASPHFFFCNEEVDGVRRLSQCDLRSPSTAASFVGVRLVRRLGAEPKGSPAAPAR